MDQLGLLRIRDFWIIMRVQSDKHSRVSAYISFFFLFTLFVFWMWAWRFIKKLMEKCSFSGKSVGQIFRHWYPTKSFVQQKLCPTKKVCWNLKFIQNSFSVRFVLWNIFPKIRNLLVGIFFFIYFYFFLSHKHYTIRIFHIAVITITRYCDKQPIRSY